MLRTGPIPITRLQVFTILAVVSALLAGYSFIEMRKIDDYSTHNWLIVLGWTVASGLLWFSSFVLWIAQFDFLTGRLPQTTPISEPPAALVSSSGNGLLGGRLDQINSLRNKAEKLRAQADQCEAQANTLRASLRDELSSLKSILGDSN